MNRFPRLIALASVLMATFAAPSSADGWGHHHGHHHHGHHHHGGWAPAPVYYYAPPPVAYYPAPAPVYYGPQVHVPGRGSLPIIAGGVIGGVLGNQIGYGNPGAIIAGSVAGSVIGHEIAH